ncbi:MAG: TonB-dependent receptor [bacterium]
MKKIYLLFLLVYTITPFAAVAANYTISGYISEKESGESLIGATVLDLISAKGAVTNVHGFYSLTVPEGDVEIEFSYVSYESQICKFTLTKDTVLDIKISSIKSLSEVVVVGNRNEFGVMGSQMSAVEVPIAQIKNIPALAGEVDVIKALQLMPGVQSGSEGGTGLYIRGGGADQNLIQLDGVQLYNVNHLFGFFSVFNADAVKNVTMYKGNFPARFGGRLSGVVDVRQNEGNDQGYHGSVSVGLLSSKFNFEGPIIKEKTTFNISARRTYFDVLSQPILKIMSSSSTTAGYYFYDVNAKVTHKFSNKDKISASFYMGDDEIYAKQGGAYSMGGVDYDESMKFSWNWGNLLSSVNWAHQFSKTLYSNLTASYTRYRYNVGLDSESSTYWSDTNEQQTEGSYIDYTSNIQDISLNYDFDYTPNPNHVIKFGANYIYHIFCPEVGSISMSSAGDAEEPFEYTVGGNDITTHEAALYIEDNWSIKKIVKLNLGLRGSLYSVGSTIYPSLEPRLGLRTLITKDLSFKASYSYMTQYVNLLSSSNLTLPTDLWVPVTENIKPMLSHQVAAGFFYNLMGILDLSVEGYYKHMTNILEYKDGSSFFGSSEGWEDKVCMGDGWSYGVEFLVQKNVGKFTGWIGYTWSKSERLFNREGMVLNNGEPFYAKYDRRHDLSVVAQYKLNEKVDFAATFVYGTGSRASLATQEFVDENGIIYEYVPERNNFLLPDYIRADVGVNFHRTFKKHPNLKSTWNISVYNVTNRQNAYLVYSSGDTLYQLSIFPIIPSVSYTFKF